MRNKLLQLAACKTLAIMRFPASTCSPPQHASKDACRSARLIRAGLLENAASLAATFGIRACPSVAAKGCLCGAPLLTAEDQSTTVPGVFLVGPNVRHGDLSFCFVYKFRQRFGIVANAICRGLGLDTKAAVEKCRKHDMYMDDFNCCEDACGDPGKC